MLQFTVLHLAFQGAEQSYTPLSIRIIAFKGLLAADDWRFQRRIAEPQCGLEK
jgi:hypothetical protein